MSQNSDSENEIFEDAVEDVKILSLDSQKEKHSVPEIDDATAVGIDTVQHDMNVLLTQDSSDNEDNCDSKPHLSSQQYQDSLNDDSNCKVNDDLNNVTSDDCDEVTKSNISDKGNNINTDETNETIGGGAVGGAASNSQSAGWWFVHELTFIILYVIKILFNYNVFFGWDGNMGRIG